LRDSAGNGLVFLFQQRGSLSAYQEFDPVPGESLVSGSLAAAERIANAEHDSVRYLKLHLILPGNFRVLVGSLGPGFEHVKAKSGR
jgi:hypothetical protein